MYRESRDNGEILKQGQELHSACGFTRSSLTNIGNAYNLMIFNHHECYEVCALQALYRVCPDGTRFLLGVCGGSGNTLTKKQAIDFLRKNFYPDVHFNDTITAAPEPPRKLVQEESFDIFLQEIKATTPKDFILEDGTVCSGVGDPINNIYDIVKQARCVYKKHEGTFHEKIVNSIKDNWKYEEEGQQNSRMLESLKSASDTLTHRGRILKHSMDQYDTVTNLRIFLTEQKDYTDPGTFSSAWQQYTENRRNLKKKIECVGYICPETIEGQAPLCVADITECPDFDLTGSGWIPKLKYFSQLVRYQTENFHLETVIKEEWYDCHKYLEKNPSKDPLHISNLLLPDEEKEKLTYCLDQISPSTERFSYWPRSYFTTSITNVCDNGTTSLDECNCYPPFLKVTQSEATTGDWFGLDRATAYGLVKRTSEFPRRLPPPPPTNGSVLPV
jgi:hypothetical protein